MMYFRILYLVTAPDGLHVITNQGNKMLRMYRVEELAATAAIGQYSLYGDMERLTFTSDSAYIAMSIVDTRLFFLMLCDTKIEEHYQRVQVC